MAASPFVLFDDDAPKVEAKPAPSEGSLAREITGGILALTSLFLTLCLILGGAREGLIGPAGRWIGEGMPFLFGSYVSYALPAAMMFVAIRLLMRRTFMWPGAKAIGAFMIVLAVCGFFALPTADEPEFRRLTFERGGAFGAFLVEWEGLGLVGAFGSIGAAFALAGMLFAGLVLTTGLGLTAVARRAIIWMRERNARKAAPQFAGPPSDDEMTALRQDPRVRPVSFAPTPAANAAPPPPAPNMDISKMPTYFDDDSEAALRALEAAEMDREFERALASEIAAGAPLAPPPGPPQIVIADEERPEILSGNPGNAPAVSNEEALRESRQDLRTRLARLLMPKPAAVPQAPAVPPTQTPDPLPSVSEAETLGDESQETLPDAIVAEVTEDPLFNDALDVRPRGVAAALEEANAARSLADSARGANLALPDIGLLEDPVRVDSRMSDSEIKEIIDTLEKAFADFSIAAKVVAVMQGPVVTRYELKPAAGIKVSRIAALEHDIAMAMRALSVRILAPIPGKAVVGIEVPNRKPEGVYLKQLITCGEFWQQQSPLGFALGKTIDGHQFYGDLRKMPHLLIAGATGTGKSVCLNSIICSMLYRLRPNQVRMIMVDPKRVELSVYDGIPHLIAPVVCEPKRAAAALAWAVEQMEERYKKLVEFGVRNIDGYNRIVDDPSSSARAKGKKLAPIPHMVIIVDELADLMITSKAEVEESIQRLAQMARAVGIHLILATQRPSVNVITGIIKANFPSRIAFQVSQKVDSRTILDQNGAEALLGRGDMLFSMGGQPKPVRLQGCFVSDQEVERIADHWRAQSQPLYEVEEFEPLLSEKDKRELGRMMGNPEDMDMLDGQGAFAQGGPKRGTNRIMGRVDGNLFVPHAGGSAQAGDDEIDDVIVRAAARLVLEANSGSTSLLQRRLKLGFSRAGRLMDMLEEMGIVGPYKGSKPRDILVDSQSALAELDSLEAAATAAKPGAA